MKDAFTNAKKLDNYGSIVYGKENETTLDEQENQALFASIPMFLGSANPLNVFLIPPNYDITGKSNMAANMAAVLSITLIMFIVMQQR